MGVSDCCVVPVERDGKKILKAAVMPLPEYLFDKDKLNELKDNVERTCELELVGPMRPDEYEFMAYLPTGSYGKADYEKITQMFTEEENEKNKSSDKSDTDIGGGI